LLIPPPPPTSPPFPYTTLFRSEIMIVCAIVGMLTAIAVPAFAKNRAFSRRSACMANLKQIESAKTVWAQENRKGNADVPVDTERSEEHTSELQSRGHLVCRLLL